jgi:asparagine synthase (glutamine-hydrolysing)
MSMPESLAELERLLARSVRQQLLADVPVGAFLSGGIDSSLVVALMCRESVQAVKTFSVGFDSEEYDEAPFARAVASHLGTDHAEMCLSAGMAIDYIPRLTAAMDEPFADSSQIPTYFVSKLARGSVTAALSGDAGDELFGGYNRYLFASAAWPMLSRVPAFCRRAVGGALRRLGPLISDRHNMLLPAGLRVAGLAEKVQKVVGIMRSGTLEELYLDLLSMTPDANSLLSHSFVEYSTIAAKLHAPPGLSASECMMFWDTIKFLPDDILVKVDRAAMSVGLETRVPMLDHRVVEFAWSLPIEMKIRRTAGGYVTKWGLRQILRNYVPSELIDRPKKGFAVPIGHWIRGPLRGWAEELLDRRALERFGVFDVAGVHRILREHQSGRQNWQHKLWTVLILQDWLSHGGRRIASSGRV